MENKLKELFTIKSIWSTSSDLIVHYNCVGSLSEDGCNVLYTYLSDVGTVVTITQDERLPYSTENFYGKLVSKVRLNEIKEAFTTEQLNDSMVEDYLKRNPEKLGDMVSKCLSLQKDIQIEQAKVNKDLSYVLDSVSGFLKKDGVKIYEALKKNVLGR